MFDETMFDDQVCLGPSCPMLCPRDDCFIRRKLTGLPEMLGDEGVPLSAEISEFLMWTIETEEGQAYAVHQRSMPTLNGDASPEEVAAFESFNQALDEMDQMNP